MISKNKKIIALFYLSISFVWLIVGIWFFLWLLSSVSLANEFCNNAFDLFHNEFRCKQPYLALIGGVISLTVSICCLYVVVKKFKRK